MWQLPLPTLFKVNRWLSLIAGLAMMAISGTMYLFPAFAPSLKSHMNYDQSQINFIGTMANVGSLAALFPGIYYKVCGPRLTCLLATAMLFGGYFASYLMVRHIVPTSNYIVMGLFFFLMGNGSSASYTAAMTTNLGNYSQQSRGLVVGTLSSFYGLSSAIFSFCYTVFFRKRLEPTILFLAVTTGGIPLIATLFTNHNPPAVESTPSANLDEERLKLNPSDEENVTVTEAKNELTHEQVFQNVNSLQMLLHIDFWLVFVLFFAGVGCGTTMLNNLGSMILSYGGNDGDQNPMVIAFSVANCAGRLLSGFISDKLAKRITRVTVLNASVLLMGAFLYTFIYASVPAFYVGVIGVGLTMGSVFAMVPTFVSERFGQSYFAINFSIICLAPSAGSYLLSAVMASKIYQWHSKPGSTRCFGKQCFQLTFVILTVVCLVAFMVGLLLMHRSRRMYDRIRKYHQQQQSTR